MVEECKEIKLEKTICALPACKRGYGFTMSYHTKKEPAQYVYASGKSIMLRNFDDSSNGQCINEHNTYATAGQISPNGNWVATADEHGNLKIFGRQNGILKYEYPVLSSVTDIAWGGESKRLAVAGKSSSVSGNRAKAINMDTGTALGELSQITADCLSIDYRHKRPFRIIVATENNEVINYEGPPFKIRKDNGKDKTHTRYPNKIKYDPTGERYISVGSDSLIQVFDAKEGTKIKDLVHADGHNKSAIYSFDWSDDGTKILTCGADKTAKIWDVEKSEVLTTFTIAETPTVDDMQMACIWNGDDLFSVSLSGAINVLDPGSPAQPKEVIQGHKAMIKTICNGPEQTFFTGCAEGRVSMWTNYKAKWFAGCTPKGINALAMNFDGTLLYSANIDKKVCVGDIASLKFTSEIVLPASANCISAGQATPIVAAGASDKVHIIKENEIVKALSMPGDITAVGFNNDDTLLAVGDKKKNLAVFNTETFEKVFEVNGAKEYWEKPCCCLEWSPDGTYLCVGAGGIMVHNVKDGYKLMNKSCWDFHENMVSAICWPKSNDKVVTVGNDQKIHRFNDVEKFSSTRNKVKIAHRHGIVGAVMTNDQTLVTVGGDHCMRVWLLQ